MAYSDGKRAERRAREYRSVLEKRRIVELTLLPGASVSRVAQAEGVNSHQVFDWRRAYRNGKLVAGKQDSCKLLPVIVPVSGAGIDAEGTAKASNGAVDASTAPQVLIIREMLQKSTEQMTQFPDLPLTLGIIAVCFAPFAEEYLFRGSCI